MCEEGREEDDEWEDEESGNYAYARGRGRGRGRMSMNTYHKNHYNDYYDEEDDGEYEYELRGVYNMRGGNNEGGCCACTREQLSTIQETLQDNHNSDLLMQAIKGNDNAIHELATTLNCDFGQLNNSICAIQGAIKEVGGQVGFSAERVINAVNAGDCQVIQAIKDCCCNTQQSILKMGYENQIATLNQTNTLQTAIAGVNTGLERGFSSLAYETQKQTCDLENAIKDSTAQILAGQRAAEMREMQNKIDALQDERQTYKLGNMMAQYSAPANNALADLSARLAKIECNQPEIAKIPYVPAAGNYVPVNYSIPMHFGYGAGYSSCNYGC